MSVLVWLRDPAVGLSLADLIQGFSDSRFCGSIRAQFQRHDLGLSWRVFFIMTGEWEEFWFFSKIILLCYPPPKKLLYVIHGFNDICQSWGPTAKLSYEITKFQFFTHVEEMGQKTKISKIQLPTPTNHYTRIFVHSRSLHIAHVWILNFGHISKSS